MPRKTYDYELSDLTRLCLTCSLNRCFGVDHSACPIHKRKRVLQGLRPRRGSTGERLLKVLREGPLTCSQAANLLTAKRGTVKNAFRQLWELGWVTRQVEGPHKSWVYSLEEGVHLGPKGDEASLLPETH